MPRNGSGAFSLSDTFTNGETADATEVVNILSDIGAEMTNSLATDGQSSMTGPIKAASGTEAAPGIAFASSTGLGIRRSSGNVMQLVAAQDDIVQVDEDGMTIRSGKTLEQEGGGVFYAGGGTDVALADGGTGASLSDPGADRILFWDDSGNTSAWLTPSTGLAISGTDLEMSHLGFEDLTDPNADRIAFWDDSAGKFDWLTPSTGLAITTTSIAVSFASQAQQETGTSTSVVVSPGRQHFHPGHPKAGGTFDGTGTPGFSSGDYGMGAITDNGTGDYTLSFDTAFSNTNYWLTAWARDFAATGASLVSGPQSGTKTSSTVQMTVHGFHNAREAGDSPEVGVSAFGDYA